MLGGRISNQEEDEVEDELAALEAEMSGAPAEQEQQLPTVPNEHLPSPQKQRESEGARPERQAMAAV